MKIRELGRADLPAFWIARRSQFTGFRQISPNCEQALLSNNFTHRNHYLPQRYQLGFANDAGKVWLFDRKTLQYRDGVPINIGVQRDFYTTVDGNGVPNDSVEKVLASLETAVWPVIDIWIVVLMISAQKIEYIWRCS
jgi:hypothetical protein